MSVPCPEPVRRGHVLLVSFHYLDGTSEGLCAARTARALAAEGWQVTVLAGPGAAEDRPSGDAVGEARAAETVETRETRETREARETVEVERIRAELRGWRAAWRRINRAAGRGFPARVASATLNLWFGCTAEESAWAAAASARGRALLAESERPVDHLFSRLNPITSHLAAERILRARPDLPWTAYFSDPWPFFLYPPPYRSRSGRWYRRRSLDVVRRICTRADALLFPSRRLADALAPVYRLAAERIFVAPHMGPDPSERDESERRDQVSNSGALVIRHAGFLMKERRVDALFEALLGLDATERTRIRLQFMGRSAPGLEVPEELEPVVTFLAPRSPSEARQWMAQADVALLVEADCEEGIFLPSKFAEYVVDGYPLLCLSPDRGTIDDYLEEGGGLRVAPTDVSGIAQALQTLSAAKQNGRLVDFAPSPELRRAFLPEVVGAQVTGALLAASKHRAG